MLNLKIIRCDFINPVHCQAEIELMKEYMTDNMGNGKILTNEENKKLIEGLKNNPNVVTLLAQYENNYVGLTNSFVNFSTFSVMNFLNIHDVIVKKYYRRMGIGKKLIEENIRIASEELNCSKITLEVRKDNIKAKTLYKSLGFNDSDPIMHFWTKTL